MGRTSKVIKDRQGVEVAVKVPAAGKLVLSVESDGRYILRATSDGGEALVSTKQLASGEMRATEHEPD